MEEDDLLNAIMTNYDVSRNHRRTRRPFPPLKIDSDCAGPSTSYNKVNTASSEEPLPSTSKCEINPPMDDDDELLSEILTNYDVSRNRRRTRRPLPQLKIDSDSAGPSTSYNKVNTASSEEPLPSTSKCEFNPPMDDDDDDELLSEILANYEVSRNRRWTRRPLPQLKIDSDSAGPSTSYNKVNTASSEEPLPSTSKCEFKPPMDDDDDELLSEILANYEVSRNRRWTRRPLPQLKIDSDSAGPSTSYNKVNTASSEEPLPSTSKCEFNPPMDDDDDELLSEILANYEVSRNRRRTRRPLPQLKIDSDSAGPSTSYNKVNTASSEEPLPSTSKCEFNPPMDDDDDELLSEILANYEVSRNRRRTRRPLPQLKIDSDSAGPSTSYNKVNTASSEEPLPSTSKCEFNPPMDDDDELLSEILANYEVSRNRRKTRRPLPQLKIDSDSAGPSTSYNKVNTASSEEPLPSTSKCEFNPPMDDDDELLSEILANYEVSRNRRKTRRPLPQLKIDSDSAGPSTSYNKVNTASSEEPLPSTSKCEFNPPMDDDDELLSEILANYEVSRNRRRTRRPLPQLKIDSDSAGPSTSYNKVNTASSEEPLPSTSKCEINPPMDDDDELLSEILANYEVSRNRRRTRRPFSQLKIESDCAGPSTSYNKGNTGSLVEPIPSTSKCDFIPPVEEDDELISDILANYALSRNLRQTRRPSSQLKIGSDYAGPSTSYNTGKIGSPEPIPSTSKFEFEPPMEQDVELLTDILTNYVLSRNRRNTQRPLSQVKIDSDCAGPSTSFNKSNFGSLEEPIPSTSKCEKPPIKDAKELNDILGSIKVLENKDRNLEKPLKCKGPFYNLWKYKDVEETSDKPTTYSNRLLFPYPTKDTKNIYSRVKRHNIAYKRITKKDTTNNEDMLPDELEEMLIGQYQWVQEQSRELKIRDDDD
ncbi:uncharacterized protein isoform X2 [Rhodnius prolixus]